MNETDKKVLCAVLSVLFLIPLAFRHQLLPFFFHESAIKSFEFRQPAPTIESLKYPAAPTTGGSPLLIVGTNFGGPSDTVAVSVGVNYCTDVSRLSATQITCTVPAGFGKDRAVIVTVNGISSERPALFSYDAPNLQHLSKLYGPTAGHDVVTATGSNFGSTAGSQIVAFFGGFRAPHVKWISPMAIEITTPRGVGTNLLVTVFIGDQESKSDIRYSYNPPSVNSIHPRTGPTTGGAVISIIGDNFGPRLAFPTAYVGSQPCIFTTWVANTVLECALPEGTGAYKSVEVAVGGQTSHQNDLFSYDSPSVSAIHPETGPTSGGTVVTVMGANFGPLGTSPTIRFNGQDCSTAYLSDTEVTCVTPPGSGSDVPLVVTVDGQSSEEERLFSYGSPQILKLTPNSGPTAGGTLVTIGGSNFGHSAESLQSIKIDGKECTSREWLSRTELLCTTPAGSGQKMSVEIVIDGVTSRSNELWSYSTPVIRSISPTHGATAGGTLITIQGENFGITAPNNQKVFIGDDTCLSSGWVSPTQFTCTTPPGVGTNVDVTVTVNRQDSTGGDGLWSYDAPSITSVEPKRGPCIGDTTVTIVGQNLGEGVDERDVSVTIGEKRCRITKRQLAQHFILCLSPEGVGENKPIVVTVNGLASSPAPVSWSYEVPVVREIEPMSGNADMPITIWGKNFGSDDTGPEVSIGGSACRHVTWISDRRITCIIPDGAGQTGPLPVVVTVAGQASVTDDATPKFTFGDVRPLVESLNPSTGPASGGTTVEIKGVNLAGDVKVTFGGQDAMLGDHDGNHISFFTVPGVGTKNVLVSIDGKSAMGSLSFSYEAPSLESVSVQNQDADWDKVTLVGKNFGPVTEGIMVYITNSAGDKTECLAVEHVSDTLASCKASAPVSGKKIHVTIGGFESNNMDL